MPEEGDDEASRRKKKKSKKGHARPRDPTLLTREPEVAPEIANEPTEEAVSGGKPIEEGEEWSMRKRRRTTIKAEEGLNEDAVPGAELQLQAEARAAMEKEVFADADGEEAPREKEKSKKRKKKKKKSRVSEVAAEADDGQADVANMGCVPEIDVDEAQAEDAADCTTANLDVLLPVHETVASSEKSKKKRKRKVKAEKVELAVNGAEEVQNTKILAADSAVADLDREDDQGNAGAAPAGATAADPQSAAYAERQSVPAEADDVERQGFRPFKNGTNQHTQQAASASKQRRVAKVEVATDATQDVPQIVDPPGREAAAAQQHTIGIVKSQKKKRRKPQTQQDPDLADDLPSAAEADVDEAEPVLQQGLQPASPVKRRRGRLRAEAESAEDAAPLDGMDLEGPELEHARVSKPVKSAKKECRKASSPVAAEEQESCPAPNQEPPLPSSQRSPDLTASRKRALRSKVIPTHAKWKINELLNPVRVLLDEITEADTHTFKAPHWQEQLDPVFNTVMNVADFVMSKTKPRTASALHCWRILSGWVFPEDRFEKVRDGSMGINFLQKYWQLESDEHAHWRRSKAEIDYGLFSEELQEYDEPPPTEEPKFMTVESARRLIEECEAENASPDPKALMAPKAEQVAKWVSHIAEVDATALSSPNRKTKEERERARREFDIYELPSDDEHDESSVVQDDGRRHYNGKLNIGRTDRVLLPDPLDRGPKKGAFNNTEKAIVDDLFDWSCQQQGIHAMTMQEQIVDWQNVDADFKTELRNALPKRQRKALQRFCQRRYAPNKHGAWDAEEDEVLRRAVAEFGKNWAKVAGEVHGRSAQQCRDRYRDHAEHHKEQQTGPWSRAEEAQLLKIVQDLTAEIDQARDAGDLRVDSDIENHELINWEIVAARMKYTRSRKRCAEKWAKMERKHGEGLATEIDLDLTVPTLSSTKNPPYNADTREYRRLKTIFDDQFETGDTYDVLQEITSAVTDHSKHYNEDTTLWSIVAQKNPGSRFNGMLRRIAYQMALGSYGHIPDVAAAETVAEKAKRMMEKLERWRVREGLKEMPRTFTGLVKKQRKSEVVEDHDDEGSKSETLKKKKKTTKTPGSSRKRKRKSDEVDGELVGSATKVSKRKVELSKERIEEGDSDEEDEPVAKKDMVAEGSVEDGESNDDETPIADEEVDDLSTGPSPTEDNEEVQDVEPHISEFADLDEGDQQRSEDENDDQAHQDSKSHEEVENDEDHAKEPNETVGAKPQPNLQANPSHYLEDTDYESSSSDASDSDETADSTPEAEFYASEEDVPLPSSPPVLQESLSASSASDEDEDAKIVPETQQEQSEEDAEEEAGGEDLDDAATVSSLDDGDHRGVSQLSMAPEQSSGKLRVAMKA